MSFRTRVVLAGVCVEEDDDGVEEDVTVAQPNGREEELRPLRPGREG